MENAKRKLIIDCDPGSDDALALMMAARSKEVEILGVTIVDGNARLEYEIDNALMTLEQCGCNAGVYPGARHSLIHSKPNTVGIFGEDGMSDQGIIHPTRKAENISAAEFIAQTVAKYPDEVEICLIAPVTNVAQAILDHPDVMKHVKHYWIMGTPGFAPGSATPVSEFNVYADPEAFDIVLRSGVQATIVGFDACHEEDTPFKPEDIDRLEAASDNGKFIVQISRAFREFNMIKFKKDQIDYCDPVLMACALWPEEVILDVERCHAMCITDKGPTYGQVLLYIENYYYEQKPEIFGINALVVKKIDINKYKNKLLDVMTD